MVNVIQTGQSEKKDTEWGQAGVSNISQLSEATTRRPLYLINTERKQGSKARHTRQEGVSDMVGRQQPMDLKVTMCSPGAQRGSNWTVWKGGQASRKERRVKVFQVQQLRRCLKACTSVLRVVYPSNLLICTENTIPGFVSTSVYTLRQALE